MACKANKGRSKKPKVASNEKATTGKFRVVVGSDWELEVFEFEGDGGKPEQLLKEMQKLEQTKLERREGVGRLNLAYTIVAALLVALCVATVWGWMHDDFSAVPKVWSVASMPLGWVAGYFFKMHGSRSQIS